MSFSVLLFGAVSVVAAAAIAGFIYLMWEASKAKKSYEQCLSLLARDPANPQLRSLALNAGQIYAGLVNDCWSRTVLNERQIRQDVEAVCARASMVPTAPPIDPMLDPESTEGRLAALNYSLSQGLISGHEYIVKREQLVGKD